MAYKNSDGASSIANEWGQWRYFNSALTKLGESKAPAPTIKPQKTVEEADDWFGAIGAVFKGIQGVYEARKELAENVADEYLQSHSLEEYKQQMMEGKVPFQDDPLAMGALKRKHGSILFSKIAQDFQDRVDANEFKGMAPEQVDAEFFKYMKEQSEGAAKVFGYADNDYFFNKGLYEDSPSQRVKMMLRQKTVEDSYQRSQDLITNAARLSAISSSENVSADLIVSEYEEQGLLSGAHEKPEDTLKKAASNLEILAANPYAGQTLRDLKDREIPHLGGVTFGQIMGEEGYKGLLIKNANAKYAVDAQDKLDYQNGLDIMANNGKAAELEALRNAEFQASGGLLTDKIKDIEKARDAAVRVQLANAKRAAVELEKQREKDEKSAVATSYINALIRGDAVYPKTVEKLTNTDIDTAYARMVDTGIITFTDQLALANNSHLQFNDNSARKYFNNQCNKAIEWLDGAVESYLTSKVLPNPDRVPKEVNILAEVYKADPTNFGTITGIRSDEPLKTGRAMAVFLNSGRPIEDLIRGRAKRKAMIDEGNKAKVDKIKSDAVKSIQDPMLGNTADIDYNGKEYVSTLAFAFIDDGDSAAQAVKKAEAEYNKSFKNFMGTSVPSSFFRGTTGIIVPDKDLIERLKKDIPKKYLTGDANKVRLSFEHNSRVLTVSDHAGNAIFSINQKQASELVDSISDDIFNRSSKWDTINKSFSEHVSPEALSQFEMLDK